MDYKDKILKNWEDVYKKGQLSFWILLSIAEKPRYIDEIKSFIDESTNGGMTMQDQSIYRALRRFDEIGLVGFTEQEGNKGPNRKYYQLTELGSELLAEFAKRNIAPLYAESIQKLIKEKI